MHGKKFRKLATDEHLVPQPVDIGHGPDRFEPLMELFDENDTARKVKRVSSKCTTN